MKHSKHDPPELEDIWTLMDYVWDKYRCNNNFPTSKNIDKFYKSPVWILNGLFIEQHKISMQHRNAITNYIISKKFKNCLDFGGGFGTLPKLIAKKNKKINIDIYEPYPSNYARSKTKKYNNIKFINKINKKYDCIVCLSVLEHVSNPLELLNTMVNALELNGGLIIMNDFNPVIKCHLPSTFHLKYTFTFFANLMGLKYLNYYANSPAKIYIKKDKKKINKNQIKIWEKTSKYIYSLYNYPIQAYKIIKIKLIKTGILGDKYK